MQVPNYFSEKLLSNFMLFSLITAVDIDAAYAESESPASQKSNSDSIVSSFEPSGTEPLIRLYFEGTSEESVENMKKGFQAEVDSILSSIDSSKSLQSSLV